VLAEVKQQEMITTFERAGRGGRGRGAREGGSRGEGVDDRRLDATSPRSDGSRVICSVPKVLRSHSSDQNVHFDLV